MQCPFSECLTSCIVITSLTVKGYIPRRVKKILFVKILNISENFLFLLSKHQRAVMIMTHSRWVDLNFKGDLCPNWLSFHGWACGHWSVKFLQPSLSYLSPKDNFNGTFLNCNLKFSEIDQKIKDNIWFPCASTSKLEGNSSAYLFMSLPNKYDCIWQRACHFSP